MRWIRRPRRRVLEPPLSHRRPHPRGVEGGGIASGTTVSKERSSGSGGAASGGRSSDKAPTASSAPTASMTPRKARTSARDLEDERGRRKEEKFFYSSCPYEEDGNLTSSCSFRKNADADGNVIDGDGSARESGLAPGHEQVTDGEGSLRAGVLKPSIGGGASGASGLFDAFQGGSGNSSGPGGHGQGQPMEREKASGKGKAGASGLFDAFRGLSGNRAGPGGHGQGRPKGKRKASGKGKAGRSGPNASVARHARDAAIAALDEQMALQTSGLARPSDGSGGAKRNNHWAPAEGIHAFCRHKKSARTRSLSC
eukprot:g13202.t1